MTISLKYPPSIPQRTSLPSALSIQPIRPEAGYGYIPCFDGMRAIAFLIVYVAHLHVVSFVPGGFGVTVFFVISGVLITRLLMAEYLKQGRISLPAFYARRFLRLSPALYVMIAITAVIYHSWGRHIGAWQYLSSLLYFAGYYKYYLAYLNHGVLSRETVWGITWSLGVEEHFYLLFPAFLVLVGPLSRRLTWLLPLICLIPLALRNFYWITVPYPEVYNYFATEARLDAILSGCALTVIVHHVNEKRVNSYVGHPSLLYLSLIAITATLLYRNIYFQECIRYSIEQVFLCIIIYQLIFTPHHRIVKWILELPLLKFIGRLSYSAYLWHTVCIAAADRYCGTMSISRIVVASTLTIAASFMSYYCIEMPLVNLRRKLGSHAKVVNSETAT